MAAEPGVPPGLGRYDGVLLDLDGTLYQGSEPVAGAAETVAALRDAGVAVRFVTNNAAGSAADVVARLAAFDVVATDDEVYTSAEAAATVLARRVERGARVLVVGTDSLAARVRAAGLRPVREVGAGVAAVVQGHDPDSGWRLLAEACVAIRAGAVWVACNADVTLPSERGELPGNGAMVAALCAATGSEPEVAGKPSPPLLRMAATEASCHRPLVVGDRLETDIAGAHAAGMDALLVLSGVTTPDQLLRAAPEQRPRYVAADVTCLSDARTRAVEVDGPTTPDPEWRARAGTALTELRTTR